MCANKGLTAICASMSVLIRELREIKRGISDEPEIPKAETRKYRDGNAHARLADLWD